MSTAQKTTPACKDAIAWLRHNLGREALASLTGTDHRALAAAAHILALANGNTHAPVLRAYRDVVLCMQEHTREFAWHLIAMVFDWHNRGDVWEEAGLAPLAPRWRCVEDPHR